MFEEKNYCVYILTNKIDTVLYVGVTSNLQKRIWEHKNNTYPTSFSSRYKIHKLVYYSCGSDVHGAIAEEKRLKGGSRKKKVELVTSMNPEWNDLSAEIGLD